MTQRPRHRSVRPAKSAAPDGWRNAWWVAVAVGAGTIVFYLPTLRSGFVYDAIAQILYDGYIHDAGNFRDVLSLRVLSLDVLDFNRPVQLASLMVDAAVWGWNPVGYHLTSILLHAANVMLVYLVAVRLGGEASPWVRVAAALGAFVFALHPVNVEAVAEVSSREDVLAAFFVLLALWLATGFARWHGRAAGWCAVGVVAASLFAVGSKETGVVCPVVVAALWWIFHRDQPRGRWVALLGGATAVVAAFVAARFVLAPRDSAVFLNPPQFLDGSFWRVFELQPRIWAMSVRNILWPVALSADYTPQNVLAISLPVGIALLVGFLAAQGVAAWLSRLAFLGTIVFWVSLAPVSNFIPIYRFAADRFLYLPMAGVAFLVAGVLMRAGTGRVARIALGGVFVFGLAALAQLAAGRQVVFSDSLALWTDTLSKSPTSTTAANNRAHALLEAGRLDEALPAFVRAVNAGGGKHADAWCGLAVTLEKLGRARDAESALSRAIAVQEVYADPDRLVKALIVSRARGEVIWGIRRRIKELPAAP